jgi:aspartyl/glutamyl-tRNA(Asn/Gln) amidotransferase C subunit
MALERSDVEKIAHLARLGLNDAELPRITDALNSILGLVDQMQAVDTTASSLAHPLEASQRLRPTRSPKAISATPTRPSHRRPKAVCTWFRKSSSKG